MPTLTAWSSRRRAPAFAALPAMAARATAALRVVCAFAFAFAFALASAFAITSCTEAPPTAPVDAFTGSWELDGVNGVRLPYVLAFSSFDGSRRLLIEGRLLKQSRGRVYDIRRMVWERPNGQRVEDITDTVTSPYTATQTTMLIRRYALLASADWVDSGTVANDDLRLRARYIEQQFGPFRNVLLSYVHRP